MVGPSGADGVMKPATEFTTVKVTARTLREGDVLASGSVIICYLALVRGGTKFAIRRTDGTDGTVVVDGRRKIEVARPSRFDGEGRTVNGGTP